MEWAYTTPSVLVTLVQVTLGTDSVLLGHALCHLQVLIILLYTEAYTTLNVALYDTHYNLRPL